MVFSSLYTWLKTKTNNKKINTNNIILLIDVNYINTSFKIVTRLKYTKFQEFVVNLEKVFKKLVCPLKNRKKSYFKISTISFALVFSFVLNGKANVTFY